MQLVLTPEVENALSAQALLQGMTPEELALETLREKFVDPGIEKTESEPQETLLDFLAGFIGVLHSEPREKTAHMSENTGKAFTRILTEKHKQETL